MACQGISLRLTPEGELFRDEAGRASLYAPGHGDVFEALKRNPGFQQFVADGGTTLQIVNVDNLGASLSTKVLGAHLAAGDPVTVEVAARAPGDKGGAPARRQGRVEIIEGFRFPEDFDISTIPVFNTNSIVVEAAVLGQEIALTWFRADKVVEGRPVVQFERLMGEITSFVTSSYLTVPRQGPEGRFLPVKTPEDLEQMQAALRKRLTP